MSNPQSSAFQPASTTKSLGALFLISVLGLFLEIMLIRWVSTEISIFAYLQNTVLVVCFLGLGMGCWTCRVPTRARDGLLPMFVLVALLALPWTRSALNMVSQFFSLLPDFPTWTEIEAPQVGQRILMVVTAAATTLAVMMLLWRTFVPLGRLLGRLLDDHPRPIKAYSVNVAGSLVGIWLFVLLSSRYLPPAAWCAVAACLALPFIDRRRLTEPLLLAGIVAVAVVGAYLPAVQHAATEQGAVATEIETVWSPYQKLTLEEHQIPTGGKTYVRHTVKVNNANFLWLFDFRPETVERFPEWLAPEHRGVGYYDVPSLIQPKAKKMLVVGAGGGNDIAGGLRGGANEIVAVEIDPAIIAIGREFHPERPYQDTRVHIVNDDARAYFANSTEHFDLIVFGLLDSHTTTAMTNARLDHYVYTRESLVQAKKLLDDGGIMILSFEATRDYIADRMHTLVRDTFGQEPISFRMPADTYGPGGVIFITGNLPREEILARIHDRPALEERIAWCQREKPLNFTGTSRVTTDDWPYIYLQKPSIPLLFCVLGIMMAILYLCTARFLRIPLVPRHRGANLLHFFFLGAAFMLLETQNISQASVALGNTWDVNAVIVSCIMVFILLANAIASWQPRLPLIGVYIMLLASCLCLYGIDLAWFNSFPYMTRAMVVGGLTCLPMLFSGIIFIRSFANSRAKDAAIGANLLGALAGGLLQCVTYLIGIHALLLLVAALYVAAAVTRTAGKTRGNEKSSSNDSDSELAEVAENGRPDTCAVSS